MKINEIINEARGGRDHQERRNNPSRQLYYIVMPAQNAAAEEIRKKTNNMFKPTSVRDKDTGANIWTLKRYGITEPGSEYNVFTKITRDEFDRFNTAYSTHK